MKKDKVIFTVVKNENYFLKKWLEYYRKHFDDCDIIVFDNMSTDGSTKDLPVKTHKLHNSNCYDPTWMWNKINDITVELLEDYKYVVYTDVDEFLITNDGSSLNSALDKIININQPCVISKGYDIIHIPIEEPDPFDVNKSILKQRKYINPNQMYDKVVMINYDPEFCTGAHTAMNEIWYSENERITPNISLIHCKKFDRQLIINRIKQRYNEKTVNKAGWTDQWMVMNNEIEQYLALFFPQAHENIKYIQSGEPWTELKQMGEYFKYDYENLF